MGKITFSKNQSAALLKTDLQSVLFHFEDVSLVSSKAKTDKIKGVMNRIFTPSFSSNKIAYWGDDNLFPQHTLSIIKKNLTLSAGFEKRAKAVFASGIKTNKDYPPFEEFVKRHKNWNSDRMQRLRDLLRLGISFQEMIFSEDAFEVIATKTNKAKNCRKSLQNPDTLVTDAVFVNLQWDLKREQDKAYISEIKNIYEDFLVAEQFKKRIDDTNYMFITELASDNEVYPEMPWTSIISSGWLDINNNEPKFIRALVKNKSTLNYAIKIKDWYWEMLYTDWKDIKEEERLNRKREELNGFNKMMSGVDATGKSIIIDVKTAYLAGRLNNKSLGPQNLKDTQEAWEIEPIPINMFDGSLKEDSNTARMEIMFSIDLDPSTYGSTPQQNRQGGSDKQQSFNIGLVTDEYIRQISVQDLEFIRDYNGWDKDLKFEYILPVMPTLADVSANKRVTQPNRENTTTN